ncbi:choline binding protein Cbp2 [Streptococcus pneumoniae]|nr:choline binding protein Cbp2 [Streptococcus pneumoniae]
MILTSLVSVAILGTGFFASQPTFVRASEEAAEKASAEADAQKEFLANYDEALEVTVKELEKADTKNNPELEAQKQKTIEALKVASAETRAKIVEGFKNGLTAKQAENIIDEANKKASEEAAEKASAEADAQKEFLANYDEALEVTVKELEKADTKNNPELEAQKQKTIEALKVASAETRAKIVEGFKNGLTAKQAENIIDEANKKASEEAAEKASAEADAQKEFLANYDEALEVTVKELEKADTKNNPELEAQKQKTIEALKVASAETRAKIVEGFKNGLTAKQAENIIDEANKKASEEAAEKASAEADAQKEFLANYDEALEVTVKELEKADTKNNPELEAQKQKTIEALKVASAETRAKIVEGFKNGLTAKQAENIIDEANKKASEEAAEKASAEADAQKEFLANYDEALEVTVKELEKADTKNNPELEAQKQKTIEALKVASAETRAKIVEGFKNGLTAKQAENIIDEANKKASEEAAEKASAEADAQKEFLANYDEALEVTVKELEKADTKNNPELEAQKQKTIEALKVASAETRAKIVEGFKNGLTAKQAENIIDEANKKASEEAAEKASAEADAQKEFLANYDEALEVTVKELEKADTKNNPELEAQKQKTHL